jgi:hypothetical protein
LPFSSKIGFYLSKKEIFSIKKQNLKANNIIYNLNLEPTKPMISNLISKELKHLLIPETKNFIKNKIKIFTTQKMQLKPIIVGKNINQILKKKIN